MKLRTFRLAGCFALASIACGLVMGDTFTETYYFTTGGISETDTAGNSFVDRAPGPDLLPYTDDDEDLDEGGNPGGTWTFAVLDNDADGVADRIFSTTRRDDDDTYTLTSYSDFQHGVIAEGEDWIDLHDAQNTGPSGDGTQGVDSGDDFEWNDRPNWESHSNWFWYNNAVANQRGYGGSRYYFELKNPDPAAPGTPYFDEVQQWVKQVNFQTNADDPNTPLNEKANEYARGSQVVIRGLLIPLDAIPDLKDGELDPLFGWYPGDMAKYVRESLGPKLEDPKLTVFITDEGGNACGRTQSVLPPTYLMIEQGEFQVEIMTDKADAFARAAYWGIEPVEAGSAKTISVLRWSRIMLKGDDDTFDDDGVWNPPIQIEPEAGSPLENLWARDKFVRQSVNEVDPFTEMGTGLPDKWGALELGCGIPEPDPDNTPPDHCWYFLTRLDEQQFPVLEDCQKDWELTIPSGSGPKDSWFALPAHNVLDARRAPVRAVADLRVETPSAAANRIQIILTRCGEPGKLGPCAVTLPVAWVDLKDAGIAKAGVGGEFGAGGGPVTNGLEISERATAAISSTQGEYTRIEIIFDAAAKKITVKSDGTELLSDTYEGFDTSEVDTVRIWTESGPSAEGAKENQIYVNEVSLFQGVPQPFVRGEINCDGTTDISDAVAVLNHLFTGGPDPCCMAAADVNADGLVDISDPVGLLGFQFLGAEKPAAPFPNCGVDWSSNLGCATFPECP